MASTREVVVWSISGLLALGVGLSRYAKRQTRQKLVRDLVGMDAARREKVLSRLNPELAMEIRQELMKRFGL